MPLSVVDITFADENSEKKLLALVEQSLRPLVEAHGVRVELYNNWRRAYKAIPKVAVKNFPWPNASNIVAPLIGMAVDAIVARLMRALLGTKDFCEVEIKSKKWEHLEVPNPEDSTTPMKLSMEKEVRDWVSNFVKASGARDRLRTLFADCAKLGDGFLKPIWAEEERMYHGYNESGQVVEMPVPEYAGVRWTVPAPDDIIPPRGFDEWQQLPFTVHVLRYTWAELQEFIGLEGYRNIGEIETAVKAKSIKKTDEQIRSDPRHVQATETASLGDVGPAQIFTFYELNGKWPLETVNPETNAPGLTYQDAILTYSLDHNLFIRSIMNPFFGKARHLVRVPFLVVEHELYGMGVAEQIEQFQEAASTAHNQVTDAGTAANAAIVVMGDETDLGNEREVYPGMKIVTPNPDKDVRVMHLGADSNTLGAMEEKAIRYAEARSGVSPYHLGMESTVVGSRATATGTTALIGEGNLRFWMSIDDIRHAVEECLYLTIGLEQQMRPEGHQWAEGRFIQFPQGDVRTSIGLQLTLTSEKINRDMEIQNLQLLMQVLNEYYMRIMQASALMQSPGVPPVHKLVIAQVMDASLQIVKRFVERFDIEDIDEVVPGLMDTINRAMRIVNGIPGIQPQLGPPQQPEQAPEGQPSA